MNFKFMIPTLATILFISMNSYAQQPTKRVVKYAPKKVVAESAYKFSMEPVAGITYSNFTGIEGRNGASVQSTLGYQGGLNAFLTFNRSFALESGLTYAQRGTKITGMIGGAGATYTANFNLKYLEIPVMARYAFRDMNSTHFFVKGGLVAGLLQDARFEMTDFKNMSFNGETETSAKEYFNSTDFRLAAGIGGLVKITKSMSWLIQGDYQMGLTRINTDKLSTEWSAYNSGFGATTGLSISI